MQDSAAAKLCNANNDGFDAPATTFGGRLLQKCRDGMFIAAIKNTHNLHNCFWNVVVMQAATRAAEGGATSSFDFDGSFLKRKKYNHCRDKDYAL